MRTPASAAARLPPSEGNFSWPDSAYDITALGLMKAAEMHTNADGTARPCVNGEGYDCGYFYMPIDRVNDRVPFQLATTKGYIVP